MSETLSYCIEVGSKVCDTCPLRLIGEAAWVEAADSDPIELGFLIDALRYALREGTISPDQAFEEVHEAHRVQVVDVDIEADSETVNELGSLVTTCFERNSAHECAPAEELLFPGMDLVNGIALIESVLKTGTPEQIHNLAERLKPAVIDILLDSLARGFTPDAGTSGAAIDDVTLLSNVIRFFRYDKD